MRQAELRDFSGVRGFANPLRPSAAGRSIKREETIMHPYRLLTVVITMAMAGTALAAGPTDEAQQLQEQEEIRVLKNDPQGKTAMERKEYQIKEYGVSPAASQAIPQRKNYEPQSNRPMTGGGKGHK